MVVEVNLTMLLVLATIFIGKSQALPTTSYPKMIDIWLIATMMVPFLEIAMHSYRCSLQTKLLAANDAVLKFKEEGEDENDSSEHTKLERRLKLSLLITQKILPIVIVFFMVVFWLL